MKRTPRTRLLAPLLALLFLLSSAGDGHGLYPCPHHGLPEPEPAGAESPARESHHGHHGHHGAPGPAGGAAGERHGPQEADGHEAPSSDCNCTGACAAGAAAAPSRGAEAATGIVPTAGPAAGCPSTESFHPGSRPYFLPYGQAPPPR